MEIQNEISKQIWEDRYKKGEETLLDNYKRVAKFCANSEEEEELFLKAMEQRLLFPAGRTMSNAGIGSTLTLNNCFNLNSVPDSIDEIFEMVKIGALTHKAGGGTGYDFSMIRPSGTPTSNDAIASGVVSFMQVFDAETATILQGNRRGANMGILNIYHPDIFEYLQSKSYDAGKLIHFNISVMIDDDFMHAVEKDEDIYLHYPVYDEKGHIIKDEKKWKIKKKTNAKALYEIIIQKAYDNGEYGVFFYDNLNKDNNTWYCETLIGTNPCGEYVSGVVFKYGIQSNDFKGACNLGSLFLHNHVCHPFTKDAYFDYGKLEKSVGIAVMMLDNIIDKNKFPHPSFENYQKNLRTIGLGITGLADTMVMLGLRYGEEKSVQFTDNLMNFITKEAYKKSISLAISKGSFPLLDKERFIQSDFIQKHVNADPEWRDIITAILKFGIRNARLISVAPTGTLSLTYGENCSSGVEPIVSLSYQRKIKFGGQSEEHVKTVDFEDYAYHLWKETIENNIVSKTQFVTIKDLLVMDHLQILKAVAFHTDMSCSKTINLPSSYSFEETKDVYKWCWANGIKGCTIFRPNPLRQGIFVTEETKKEPPAKKNTDLSWGTTLEMSDDLIGKKRKVMSGCGAIHVQAWFDRGSGKMMELYLSKGAEGGCNSFMVSNSRGYSLALRSGASFENVIDQLKSTPTCPSYAVRRAIKKDTSPGTCCPSAIANALIDMQNEVFYDLVNKEPNEKKEANLKEQEIEVQKTLTLTEKEFMQKFGEIAFAKRFNKCPVCYEDLNNSEGCLSCRECSWSKCG